MNPAPKRPPVGSIVSKKKSGKTTLIEWLIPILKERGYRIGTVKHDTHGFDIDHEGKDTWRHKQSGAERVLISSPWKLSLIQDVQTEWSLDTIVETYFLDMDLVLTEGYAMAGKPKIEVFLSTAHATPLHDGKEKTDILKAVVSDVPLDLGVPRFEMDDVQGLADFIETTFLKAEKP